MAARLVMLAVVLVALGVSTGCVLPGCGDGPNAPASPSVSGTSLESETGSPTADTASASCDGELDPPSVSLDEPAEMSLSYGRGCSGDDAVYLDLSIRGFALESDPGLAWTVIVEGGATESGETHVPLTCGDDGALVGRLAIDLPVEADGRVVTIEVVMTTDDGTEVRDEVSAIARVSQED